MRSALIWLRLDALMKTRIPTILGLGVLIVGIVAGVLLVGEGTGGFLPRAGEEAIPQQVRITNISDTSFSVSFITQAPSIGMLEYGEDAKKLNQKILDDRDQLSGESSMYRTHHVTVANLNPSTQYYFRIGTERRSFFDNQGSPFTVRTSRPGLEPSDAQAAQGKIKNQASSPANGALIYVTSPGASPLSAYGKQDGSWTISLAKMRTQDASAIFSFEPETELKIQVIGIDGETLDATIKYRQLNLISELQFGQDINELLLSGDEPDEFAETDDLANLPDDEFIDDEYLDETELLTGNQLDDLMTDDDRFGILPQSEITIVYPARNEEVVSATKPEISGKAPPQSVLQIEVNSENTYYDVVETDEVGNWAWSPPDDLEPGSHSVTIRYTDDNGVQQVETRNFLVQADSTYPSFVSTPSGQLATPSPTPTLLPSPTPIPTPLPSPVVVSPKPSPSLISYPATKAAQPVSSSSGPLWLMGAGAFFFSGLGIAWWVIKPARAERTYGQPFT